MPLDIDDPWADDGGTGSGRGHTPAPAPAAAVDLDPALDPALDPPAPADSTASPQAPPRRPTSPPRSPSSTRSPTSTRSPPTSTRALIPDAPSPSSSSPLVLGRAPAKPISRSPSLGGLTPSRTPSRASALSASASHPLLGRDTEGVGLGRDRDRGGGTGGASDMGSRRKGDPSEVRDRGGGDGDVGDDLALDSRALGPHPLRLTDASLSALSLSDTDVSDVSRPALRRATTEAQSVAEVGREYASSTPSNSDTGVDVGEEVEVVVHQIKTGESLPGIALRYGIDIAALRKVNKLWPSDPIHLRTTLYVPLDACSGDVVRGPGEGQVTLKPKRRHPSTTSGASGAGASGASGSGANGSQATGSASGANASAPSGSGSGTNANGPNGSPGKAPPNGTWRTHSRSSSRDTAVTLKPPHDNSGTSGPDSSGPSDPTASSSSTSSSLVLDIVRLPASQLRFFPRARRGRGRSSLDRRSLDRARTSDDSRRSGGGLLEQVLNNTSPPSSRVVRLRPPSAPVVDGSSLKGRLVGLFSVPPPPSAPAQLAYPPDTRRESLGGAEGGTGGKGKGKGKSVKEEIVEMDARAPRRYVAAGGSARRPPRVSQVSQQSAAKAKRD